MSVLYPYIRLLISKAAAAVCQSLPMAISGSCFSAVFCVLCFLWQKYGGKLGQKAANIGKMWDKQTTAKGSINFTLAFSDKYWHKKSDKMIESQETMWQKVAKSSKMQHKQIMAMIGTSVYNWPKFSETANNVVNVRLSSI